MSSSTTQPRPQREQWSGQLGFLMAAIGSAIGLGNIWRFPGVAYTNGGGAFMVPYIIALLAAGLPVLFLDYALGHRFRGSAPTVFRRLSRRFEWLGWWQVFISFVIMTYYAVVVGWSLAYTVFSVTLAWGDDAGSFFYSYIGLAEEPTFAFVPILSVIAPLVLVWVFGIITVARGVAKGVEKANRIFLPLLVVMFLVLVVRALLLPGATDGLNALFTPQWGALGNYEVWLAAFGQIFFSLSVGFGIMLTYASYLKPRSNLVGTGLTAAFANSSFEILAGIGVFATLGFMAHVKNVGVADLEGITGVGLSFVTFPTVISQMPGGALFGVLFFGSFSMAGLTSFISILQVVAPAVAEKTGWSVPRATVVAGVSSAVLSVVLFATTTGLYTLDVVDAYINNIGVVGSTIIMCVGIGWVLRRTSQLQRHLNLVSETRQVGWWWRILISFVVPVVLGYMFFQAVGSYAADGYGYGGSFEAVFGWGMLLLGAVLSVVFSLVKWRTPVDDFQPIDLDVLEGVK
ncbi:MULTISPECIES: sodium-dependent transporter [Actinomyces]|uniref:Sodium-dependent transporter n=1 Tax=Actinomyces respiraculi TaxID=2744574 RepID=A0A7T0LJ15_9ACTO|nr:MULTISPECIES: sodium-dependent transporter [Actinomyces]QPL04654.1 sodium-dependent transporter [Actinomyces respiraculi]